MMTNFALCESARLLLSGQLDPILKEKSNWSRGAVGSFRCDLQKGAIVEQMLQNSRNIFWIINSKMVAS